MNALKKFEVYGLKAQYYFPLAIVVLAAVFLGWLPKDFGGTFGYMFVIAGFLFWLGKQIPVVKEFGGPVLLPLFAGALLKYFNLLPEGVFEQTSSWLKSWQNLLVGAVLVGSIMNVDRHILLKTVTKYIPAILAGHLLAFILVGVVGTVLGMDLSEAILYVAVPCLSGGVSGPSAVLGPMYTELAGEDLTSLSGLMVCYNNIANVLSILGSAFLAKLCAGKPSLDGNGNILVGSETMGEAEKRPGSSSSYGDLGTGILVCSAIMIAGTMINKLVPQVHGIAWAIIIAIVIKCTAWLPTEVENCCIFWNNCMSKNFLAPLIFAIGITYLDLGALAEYFTPLALILILVTLIGATLGSMIVAKLVGLYPLETGLSAGLCSCNTGGSGDIACLSAANRMSMLPFASISTRIGGGLMLIWASLLFPILMK